VLGREKGQNSMLFSWPLSPMSISNQHHVE
jgi:hypothetical protein